MSLGSPRVTPARPSIAGRWINGESLSRVAMAFKSRTLLAVRDA